MSDARFIRITHKPSGEVIAEGPLGWGIMSFEGNYYIRRRYLKTKGFNVNFIPGLCVYKFLYVWLDFSWSGGKSSSLGWPMPRNATDSSTWFAFPTIDRTPRRIAVTCAPARVRRSPLTPLRNTRRSWVSMAEGRPRPTVYLVARDAVDAVSP